MNKALLGIGILVLLAVVGYVLATQNNALRNATTETAENVTELISPIPEAVEDATKQKNVILSELNSSGMDGTAVLAEKDGKVVVTINMTGEPENSNLPAHIHIGECPGIGAIKYPLKNVVDGSSETVLEVDMETLLDQRPLALNVHASAAKMGTYVACGNL